LFHFFFDAQFKEFLAEHDNHLDLEVEENSLTFERRHPPAAATSTIMTDSDPNAFKVSHKTTSREG